METALDLGGPFQLKLIYQKLRRFRIWCRERRGGEGGIRTHGDLRLSGFQDRRIRPLCHLSAYPSDGQVPGHAARCQGGRPAGKLTGKNAKNSRSGSGGTIAKTLCLATAIWCWPPHCLTCATAQRQIAPNLPQNRPRLLILDVNLLPLMQLYTHAMKVGKLPLLRGCRGFMSRKPHICRASSLWRQICSRSVSFFRRVACDLSHGC